MTGVNIPAGSLGLASVSSGLLTELPPNDVYETLSDCCATGSQPLVFGIIRKNANVQTKGAHACTHAGREGNNANVRLYFVSPPPFLSGARVPGRKPRRWEEEEAVKVLKRRRAAR